MYSLNQGPEFFSYSQEFSTQIISLLFPDLFADDATLHETLWTQTDHCHHQCPPSFTGQLQFLPQFSTAHHLLGKALPDHLK